jgi:hypothetical protein
MGNLSLAVLLQGGGCDSCASLQMFISIMHPDLVFFTEFISSAELTTVVNAKYW